MLDYYKQEIGSIILESLNKVERSIQASLNMINPRKDVRLQGLFESRILLEADDESESDLDFGGDDSSDEGFGFDDNDNDDDSSDGESEEVEVEVDVSDKLSIAHIKEGISALIDIGEYLDTISSEDFSEPMDKLYNLQYMFSNYLQNYASYEDKEKAKILLLFKRTLIELSNEIKKSL